MENGFNSGREVCSDMFVDHFDGNKVVAKLGATLDKAHNLKPICTPSDQLPHDTG